MSLTMHYRVMNLGSWKLLIPDLEKWHTDWLSVWLTACMSFCLSFLPDKWNNYIDWKLITFCSALMDHKSRVQAVVHVILMIAFYAWKQYFCLYCKTGCGILDFSCKVLAKFLVPHVFVLFCFLIWQEDRSTGSKNCRCWLFFMETSS